MASAPSLAQTASCPHHNACFTIFAELKKLPENGKCFSSLHQTELARLPHQSIIRAAIQAF